MAGLVTYGQRNLDIVKNEFMIWVQIADHHLDRNVCSSYARSEGVLGFVVTEDRLRTGNVFFGVIRYSAISLAALIAARDSSSLADFKLSFGVAFSSAVCNSLLEVTDSSDCISVATRSAPSFSLKSTVPTFVRTACLAASSGESWRHAFSSAVVN